MPSHFMPYVYVCMYVCMHTSMYVVCMYVVAEYTHTKPHDASGHGVVCVSGVVVCEFEAFDHARTLVLRVSTTAVWMQHDAHLEDQKLR
jgi:hypothetical protein